MMNQVNEVRLWFLSNGIKTKDIAEAVGYSVPNMSNYLTGKRQCSKALAFFKCSFLMRAANPADILKMQPDQIKNGRLYYTRSKTGKEYSVKVEPELAELLKGRGDAKHLWRTRIPSYTQGVNKALKQVAAREGLPQELSCYWARHSVASILYNRGASMDIVSATLGHSLGGARVTSVYVDDTLVAVDKAFRALLDALLKDEG